MVSQIGEWKPNNVATICKAVIGSNHRFTKTRYEKGQRRKIIRTYQLASIKQYKAVPRVTISSRYKKPGWLTFKFQFKYHYFREFFPDP